MSNCLDFNLGNANLLEPPDLYGFSITISHLLCYEDFVDHHERVPFGQNSGVSFFLILSN